MIPSVFFGRSSLMFAMIYRTHTLLYSSPSWSTFLPLYNPANCMTSICESLPQIKKYFFDNPTCYTIIFFKKGFTQIPPNLTNLHNVQDFCKSFRITDTIVLMKNQYLQILRGIKVVKILQNFPITKLCRTLNVKFPALPDYFKKR